MEKLLSKQLKNQNQYATHLTGQRTKNIFFSCGGYENIFLPRLSEKLF